MAILYFENVYAELQLQPVLKTFVLEEMLKGLSPKELHNHQIFKNSKIWR